MGVGLCLDADTQSGVYWYKLSERPGNCEYCPDCEVKTVLDWVEPGIYWRCRVFGELWRYKQEYCTTNINIQAYYAKMLLTTKHTIHKT